MEEKKKYYNLSKLFCYQTILKVKRQCKKKIKSIDRFLLTKYAIAIVFRKLKKFSQKSS